MWNQIKFQTSQLISEREREILFNNQQIERSSVSTSFFLYVYETI